MHLAFLTRSFLFVSLAFACGWALIVQNLFLGVAFGRKIKYKVLPIWQWGLHTYISYLSKDTWLG
jgi:hypothetical protein